MSAGDVTLAGFTLTREEWEELDPESREQLLEADREARAATDEARVAAAATPPKRWARGTVPPGWKRLPTNK
jgi:hypothetical protein